MANSGLNKDRRPSNIQKVDTKEFELPETVFISDIDAKVFQGIVLQCLSQIEGIDLVESNFIDNFFGRGGPEITGIQSEHDTINHSVNIKIEVNICYGVSIPEKAEEIQTRVSEEITKLTGLHVSSVHVVFKNMIPTDQTKQMLNKIEQMIKYPAKEKSYIDDDYNDDF